MTLAQALTMRAGIAADDEACEAPIGGRIDDATLIANLNKQKPDFAPGSYFAYSNCGYDLAGVVIARVSGTSYARFIEKRIFAPLGMTASYRLGARNEANFAQGYAAAGRGWKVESATPADRAFASGNLVSTPGDMQRWNRSLLNATLLSRSSLEKMFAVPTLAGSAHTHYASGWFVEPSGVLWHGGTLAGYGTVNFLVPATGYSIVLLSNTGPSDKWKPFETARELYNAAKLGAALPPLLPRVRMTAPH
jgi:D-alanyl-D-alanine carboxypeptidase